MSEQHKNEKALQAFLLDIDCLDELLPWTGKFNLFDVLKISRTEIRHSNMLAWLLNANENHGMGDAFIKGIFQRIAEGDEAKRHDVFDLLLLDYHSFTVLREWKNIDLLLVSYEEKTLMAIENKVGSHEHSDQLNRYRKILEDSYPDFKRIYVFLTPEGEAPSDTDNWETITYSAIIQVLTDIRKRIEMLPDVALMIDNYMDVVRRDIVDDTRLIEVCNRIYNKHKKALDLIFEYKTDNKAQIVDVIRSVLREMDAEGKIIYLSDTPDSWICFRTKRMDAVLPLLENDKGSWNSERVYNYSIYRTENDIKIQFEVGGWNVPEQTKDRMLRMIEARKPNDKKRADFRYKRLYSKKYMLDDDDIESSVRAQTEKAVNDVLAWEAELLKELNM